MNSFLRYLWLVLVLVLATTTALAQSQSPWKSLDGESFSILYQRKDSLNAQNIFNILSEDFFSINYEIKANVATPIQVFIAPTKSGFQHLTNSSIPHWGEAVAIPSQQKIIVKSPRWHRPSQQLRIILNHELVHVLAGIATGQTRLPRWFNEGLAIYVSGDLRYIDGKELPHAVANDQVLKLKEIDSVLSFHQLRANLAYQQSFATIQYIVEAYSHTSLPKLLNYIAEFKDFNRGFHKTFGFTITQFELEFRQYLEKKYQYSFLLDFESWLWALMLLLFFLAVGIKKYRNHKKLQQWENEQPNYDLEDYSDNW
ncbi:MAG: hypothetical protein DWQ05_02885 [Calditrichaeota bacterium]|nr:MAG: hypothetical protein DWQ05_02885 [Calditrichota bacterium]